MAQPLHDVLLALGARVVRPDILTLDAAALDLRSVFGGALAGTTTVQVTSPEAFVFVEPLELVQCGTLWLPGIETHTALARAIRDAHDAVRARLDEDQQTLEGLGLTAQLIPPEPRARARLLVGTRRVLVVIDPNGDLVLESVDGVAVAPEHAFVVTPGEPHDEAGVRLVTERVDRLAAQGVLPTAADFEVEVDDDAWTAGAIFPPPASSLAETGVVDRQASAALEEAAAGFEEDDVVADLAPDHSGFDGESVPAPSASPAPPSEAEARPGENGELLEEASQEDLELLDASDEAEPVAAEPAPPAPASIPPLDLEQSEAQPPTLSLRRPAAVADSADPVDGSKSDEFGQALTMDGRGPPAPSPSSELSLPAASPASDESSAVLPAAPASAPAPVAHEPPSAQPALAEVDEYEEPTIALAAGALGSTRPAAITAAVGPVVGPAADPPSVESPTLDVRPVGLGTDAVVDDEMPTSVGVSRDAVRDAMLKAALAAAAAGQPPLAYRGLRRPSASDEEVEAEAAGFDDGEGPRIVSPAARNPLTVESADPANAGATNATGSQSDESPAPVVIRSDSEDDNAALEALLPSEPKAVPVDEAANTALVEARMRGVPVDASVRELARRSVRDTLHAPAEPEEPGENPDELDERALALEDEARALRHRANVLRALRGQQSSRAGSLLRLLGSAEGEATGFTEGGVSLAAVQAALGDPDGSGSEATHVGAVRITELKQPSRSGDDVFETAGPPADDFKSSDWGVSVGRPTTGTAAGVIGLVVEDPRARERLKKHLTPCFRRLVEMPDAATAARQPDLPPLEALVLVRPRNDEATREGIERLGDGPTPPAILVISSDPRFDAMPEVSLRLPLGQRASEVAQQVLEGLRTLGVEPLAGTDGA